MTPFLMWRLWRGGVSLVPTCAGPPEDSEEALEWIRCRRIDVAGMITHRLPLARIGEGFKLVAEGGDCLKVIIEPGR